MRNFIILLLLVASSLQAQTNKTDLDLNVNVASRYFWRGMLLSKSPVVQPDVSLNINNFYLGAFGSYTFQDEPYQELDLYLGWANDYLDISLTDYYTPSNDPEQTDQYCNFRKGETGHTLDLIVTWSGSDKLPFYLTAATIIYGDDLDEKGNNYYSSYLEAGYSFTHNTVTIKPFIGITPHEGEYADEFNVVNTGIDFSKKITLNEHIKTDASLTLAVNPASDKAFMIFSIGF
ncbi:hypothetical protein DMA11_15725 [Marinilabiliaceae bacterium JC017]|nr:hypothetical protein DMA11_15725 [Marinilabiliaceae bacterium JC017]